MASDQDKKAFASLLESYMSLGDSAGTIVRKMKKTANSDIRGKLVKELRSLDTKRLELLEQMENLPKSK